MSEPETETPFRLPPCLLTEPKNLRYIHFFYLYEYVYLIFSVFPARIRNGATNSLPDSFLSPPPGLEQSFSSTPTPGSPTNRKGSNPAAFRIKLKAFPCYPCSGYNLGISVVDPLVIREEQRSYETGNYAFNNKFWQNLKFKWQNYWFKWQNYWFKWQNYWFKWQNYWFKWQNYIFKWPNYWFKWQNYWFKWQNYGFKWQNYWFKWQNYIFKWQNYWFTKCNYKVIVPVYAVCYINVRLRRYVLYVV